MATKTFFRGQTKPNISRSLVRRRGGDISQFSEESIKHALESGKITIEEEKISQQEEDIAGFESEELQMSVAGKSDIERATGQSLTREAFFRDFGTVRGISSPNISTPQGPGRIETTEEGRQIFVPAGTPVELQRTVEGFTKSFPRERVIDVTTPKGSLAQFIPRPQEQSRAERGEAMFVSLQAGERRAELFFSGGRETGFRGFVGRQLAIPVTSPSNLLRAGITLGTLYDKARGKEFSEFIEQQKFLTLRRAALDVALLGFGPTRIGRGIKAITPKPIRTFVGKGVELVKPITEPVRTFVGKGVEKGVRIADIIVEKSRIPRFKFFTETKVVGGLKPPELVEITPSLSKVVPEVDLIVQERAISTIAGKGISQTKFGLPSLKLGFKVGKPQVAVFGGQPAKGTGVISEVVNKDFAIAQETFILAKPTRKGIEKIGIQARSIIARQEPGIERRLFLRRFGFRGAEATKSISLGKTFSKGKIISGAASFGDNIRVADFPSVDIFASRTQDIILKPSGRIEGRGISRQIMLQFKPKIFKRRPFSIKLFRLKEGSLGENLKIIELSKQPKISPASEALIKEQLKPTKLRFFEIPLSKIKISPRLSLKEKGQPKPVQKEFEIKKISLKLATTPIQKTSAREAAIALVKPAQARATAQLPKQITAQLPLQITGQVPATSQLIKQVQLQVPKQITAQPRTRTPFFNIPSRLDIPPPRFIIPTIPLFGRIGEGRLGRGMGVKRPTRFQASLVGLLSGIKTTAPVPKRLTGIEIRLPRNGGRKHGKKKKK